jgi:hypothetical protein
MSARSFVAVLVELADPRATAVADQLVLNLRGILRGKIALGDADPGLSWLPCARVFPGQALYQERWNRSVGHGKEKVYGSIP